MPATSTPSGGAPRVLGHPSRDAIRLEDVLHALADPVRLGIVLVLDEAEGECSCSVFDAPVSKSTLTHHFRVLREHGVITQAYRGTAKMNALRRDDLEDLFPGLLDTVLTAARRQAAAGLGAGAGAAATGATSRS
ncbi:ArsR/SmtB family transcription factor [Streptomyces ochraceiscleroticus]|uniref:ArsR/SmtB family transcription factor n=1 Tax=Streptomyces ochraceiscleroticus TaxID=47761 RepID=A0ABW1MHQ2_9ACTN|nr:helix-turn-helix transcriptional regulator [Streptomyces ochraceiscleroticus]